MIKMIKLNRTRFADCVRNHPEADMGYRIASAYLKDGRGFRQVITNSGYSTSVSGHQNVPLSEADYFIVTHERGAKTTSWC